MRTMVAAVVGLLACAAPAAAQTMVAVQASNLAEVSESVLGDAQRRVSAIFGNAGVTITWVDSSAPMDDQLRLTLLLVHYTSKRNVSAEALGMAPEPERGIGRVAYVFWDRVREHALHQQRSLDVVLAFVMAHELGHLLLPRYSHSPFGVMSEKVNGTAFMEAVRGRLTFSGREAARMRERILQHEATQQARSLP